LLKSERLIDGQLDFICKFINRFPNNIQIAFALIKNGHATYFGVKRNNDSLISILNGGRVFEIGSITKVFSSTLLANFVVNGKFKLEDKINSIFDFPFSKNLEFTFKESANHSSGLHRLPGNIRLGTIFNPSNPYKNYTQQKLDEYLQNDVSLDYPKRSKSEYSNLEIGLVSYTLTIYSGHSFEKLAKEMIFDKFDMLHSSTD